MVFLDSLRKKNANVLNFIHLSDNVDRAFQTTVPVMYETRSISQWLKMILVAFLKSSLILFKKHLMDQVKLRGRRKFSAMFKPEMAHDGQKAGSGL